jgi:PAS domain S-box-containing protein
LGLERSVAALSGAGAALLGIAGLVGWGFGLPVLTRIAPGYKAIAPIVAFSLIILGLVLPRLASGRAGRRERVLSGAVVGLISLFGLLEVIGFLVGADVNREDVLTLYLARASSIPFETMSPVAGALLFLVGAALLALLLGPIADRSRRKLGDTAGVLGLVAATVALVFGLGYAFGAPLLYGGPAIPIAATAALGGLLLAGGTVAAAGRDHWPLRALAGDSARARLLRAFVPLTVFIALTISVADHRLAAVESLNHLLVASMLAVVFALVVGLVASRMAQAIGETIDQARREQQVAEDALRESREDLNRAQAVARTGSWRLNVLRDELLWSDETYRMFGIPRETPMTYEAFLATVYPDDQEYVDRKWTAALGGEEYDIEHRIVVGDAVKWVRERAHLEFDKGGRLLGGFGTVQDITERKRAEQERERLLQVEHARARLAETLAAEISHRTKNNLAMVVGLLQMQIDAQPGGDGDARILRDAITRIATFGAVHEQLYERRADVVEVLDAMHRIADLARQALSKGDVEVSVEGERTWYPAKVATNICVVGNELLTNAIKHGAPGPDGRLRIRIGVALRDGKFRLSVWNSGNPVPRSFDPREQKAMGLRLVCDMAEREYRGTFTVRAHEGGTLAEIVMSDDRLRSEG